MDMPSITILAIGSAVVAIAAAALWYVSGRALRVANTSQELLELFEDDVTVCRRAKPISSALDAAHPGAAGFHGRRTAMQAARTVVAPQVRHRWAHSGAPAQ